MSSFGSIYSVRSGLDAARRALDIVGQNIANASTQGYTRQEASFIAAEPTNVIKSAGRGISDTLVLRYRDEFLDRAFRNRTGMQGYYDTLSTQLSQVEEIVGDLSEGGLRTALDQFFNAWDNLANRPTDSAARAQVVTAAEDFIDTARAIFGDLTGVRTNVDESIGIKVKEINSAAEQIATLNQEIMTQEVGRQPANELRDQRDRLLDSLARLAGTTTVTHNDGSVTVYLGSLPLVDRNLAFPINATQAIEPDLDPGAGTFQQSTTTLTWNGTPTPALFTSGEVAGLMQVRDQIVPEYMKYLDNLVRTVATAVNTEHTNGIPAADQVSVFTGSTAAALGSTWLDIVVNPVIKADHSKIVAAATVPALPALPAPSDGGRALTIARLRDDTSLLSGKPLGTATVTASEYLRAISAHLGIDVQQASRQSEAAGLQVTQADRQRQSVSGVSLDDEMTKMIQFQQTYNAAARMMTTLDEMLDVVVNRIGLVGR
ncbi:MAG TPA: flagellar hook-associated protein FlgK [Symbiobacteriaceae bacterium]|nr:flagellar hook-associated protein FlgK [Symbiobacteriaceae bacterium]